MDEDNEVFGVLTWPEDEAFVMDEATRRLWKSGSKILAWGRVTTLDAQLSISISATQIETLAEDGYLGIDLGDGWIFEAGTE